MEIHCYGVTPGRPNGYPEDTTRCVASVPPPLHAGWADHQCRRTRGYGPSGKYCLQHARILKQIEHLKG